MLDDRTTHSQVVTSPAADEQHAYAVRVVPASSARHPDAAKRRRRGEDERAGRITGRNRRVIQKWYGTIRTL